MAADRLRVPALVLSAPVSSMMIYLLAFSQWESGREPGPSGPQAIVTHAKKPLSLP